jgi:sugar phosphate isomerase/epimerase
MRTSVSNIAWGGGYHESIARRLVDVGIRGVELAPTAVWQDAPHLDLQLVRDEAHRWNDAGLEVVSIQSLLFGHPELKLFEPETHDALEHQLGAMIELAAALGAGVAVFGSPRNRQRGSLDIERANEVAARFLGRLSQRLDACGVTLTLEPNAPAYGADFVTTYAEAVELADLVVSPHVRPQIDVGCAMMVGDVASELVSAAVPAHVHVSAPQLAAPDRDDPEYERFAAALATCGYAGWVSLEMLGEASEDGLPDMDTIAWFAGLFGDAAA